nr:pentatricopeptide repeat-containing protein [Tanacetum cinerariifolium]
MFIEFVIQNQFFSYSLNEFAQILDIPCEGVYVFTDKWSLDELAYSVPTYGPYQTNPPSPTDIILYILIDQEGQVCRIRHEEEINVYEHQILTREIVPTLKPFEEIIWKMSFVWGGNQDHVPTCLCYMLYYVANFENFNLAYYMAKRMEWVTRQPRSERLERIVAREEVVTPLLLPPPSTNHPPLILTMMMMEMAKGPRVQELLLPFTLLTP